jgi:hypothetical protein
MPAGMTIRQLMKGRYIRPARSMPDPLKEAMAVREWKDLGRDLTSLFGESGIDFRDSIAQREEDDRWMEEHNVAPATDQAPVPPFAPAPAEEAAAEEDDAEDMAENEDATDQGQTQDDMNKDAE